MTAAHCDGRTANTTIRAVRVGEWRFSSPRASLGNISCIMLSLQDCEFVCKNIKPACSIAQNIGVEKTFSHPEYRNLVHNDIALVKLDREVQETKFVSFICLPWWDDQDNYERSLLCFLRFGIPFLYVLKIFFYLLYFFVFTLYFDIEIFSSRVTVAGWGWLRSPDG